MQENERRFGAKCFILYQQEYYTQNSICVLQIRKYETANAV